MYKQAIDTATALQMSGVSKVFGGVQALDDIDFSINTGEVHCLAGENGCGKSTLIKIVTGVYSPETGALISIFGHQQKHITPNSARAQGIAVIWQDLALFPRMSVAENICFDAMVGAWPRLVTLKTMAHQACAVLERLGVRINPHVALDTLPIAQRQIVAIARALIGDARLIFMDEPTASLTQQETDRLLAIVKTLLRHLLRRVF